jgi:hypothetical protein
MKRRSIVRVVLTVLCIGAFAGAIRSQPAAAPRVKMLLRALATPAGEPSFENASSDVVLSVGETGATTISTMSDLCTIAAGSGVDRLSGPHHAWSVRFTLVSVQIDKITVDVTMDRRDNEPSAARNITRHLVLTENAPHILDFVEADASESCAVRSMVLQVSAAFEEAPAFARELLSYDLWLTHRDAAGREWTRHESRSARQGELVDFRFRPLRWTVDVLLASGDRDAAVDEHVSGAIRGRIREDGRIDVSFQTMRELAVAHGSTGGRGGRKIFIVQSGEPVRVELPPATGRSTISRANGPNTQLDYAELFGGHSTAVILKVERVPR